ncbi:MAG: SGNH/GDSL hydrolase family protein [Actinomycetota bacterium]|nr:SGNH/GDSL hydrolase family protein [Actinomycetota bacterium]
MSVYRLFVLAIAVAVLPVLALPAGGTAQVSRSPGHYVALGDSYAAGPGIPLLQPNPIGCQRSTRNYPALLATALRVGDVTDVSCSGARTDNMTVAQQVPLGTNPPQFDALRPDTDLVTLSIGGNDIGFSDIFHTCARLGAINPLSNPCERRATASGTDIYAQRIATAAPKVAEVLRGIRERSPRATVLLVGYLRILPPAVGCYPVFPIARGDVPYLDGLQQRLTAMLADQAGDHGAVFVDTYAGSLGHDACQLPSVKWVEGTAPTSPAFPVHPNALGMDAVTVVTLDTLRELDEATALG